MAALLMKRWGFRFENEIRVACFRPAKGSSTAPDGAVAKAIQSTAVAKGVPANTIGALLIDPYLAEWQSKELIRLFESKLKAPFKIKRSSFDSDPGDFGP
jgi:hypothetical protein